MPDLLELENKMVSAVETKLEEKTSGIEKAVEEKVDGIKTELEASFEEKLNAHKQEMIELSKQPATVVDEATEVEKVQLQIANSCIRQGEKQVTLEDLRKYHDELTLQIRKAVRGEEVKLDATLAGFAGFDDARGGALIIPEVDKNIRQDWIEYDEGLFNSINFEPAMSRTKKIIVDKIEPDKNVKGVKETLEKINYTIDDGCFVSATLNLKDYDGAARLTYDQIEDEAFRIENYINGKMVTGCRRKVAKDLWFGNAAEQIRGIMNYETGTNYGQVAQVNVTTTGSVTMDDIMNLCKANRSKGVLFIDRVTWAQAITEKDDNGRYKFELGFVAKGMGTQPFHVDAVVPLLGVPVVFDDAFNQPEAIAKNIVAAILPPSAVAGYKRPTGRFMVKNDLKFREMLLTERYDAVLTQFHYVKLLNGVQAS